MIPTKTIVDKANADITTGGLTDLEYTQLVSTDVFLDLVGPKVVDSFSLLPSAANNEGIMYYVTNESIYYFSDGTMWRKDFTSDVQVATTVAYAWGNNSNGRLGDNSTTDRSSPVTVVGGITTWSQLAGGDAHSLGFTTEGILYAWGSAADGRLGDNTTVSKSSPVTVVGGITTWTQISGGYRHSLGITNAGIAYAWGYNGHGRLGDNSTTDRSSPVTVVGGITTWSQVSAGGYHSLGLTSAGIAYAWGNNGSGRLGDNTTTSRSSPVTISGGITTWSQISAGRTHNLGFTTAGILYAWGYGSSGELGDNAATSRSSPVTVVGGITTWSQISAGKRPHSLGLASAGIAYAWGRNGSGDLGDNTVVSKSSPVTVVGGITNWAQVSAGGYFSLGRTSTGIAYAWGYNGLANLGDNSTTSRSSPVTVAGGITNWSQLDTGTSHSLGLFVQEEATKGFA